MSFDPERYAAGLRRLNRREEEEIRARAAEARKVAEKLAERIGSTDPEVDGVYLFGSLLRSVPRSRAFDIDLAIDGGDIDTAVQLSEEPPFVDWSVDIVSLRRLPVHVAERILATGTVLYRRLPEG
jgi:predicted nucleotidyltransferase